MPNPEGQWAALKRLLRSKKRFQRYEKAWHWFFHHVVEPVPWLKFFRFGVAVLLAGVLWYLLKLSHDYSVDISFPIAVGNPPVGYMISGQSEQQVRMRVRGNGYALLRYRTFMGGSPLQIDLQEVGVEGGEDTVTRRCMSRTEMERILTSQIPAELTLEHFATEQLCYDLSRLGSRKLPVVASVRYTLHRQFAQFQPMKLSLDSVTVVGPAAELSKMEFAHSDTLDLGEISTPQRVKVTFSRRGDVQFVPSDLTCEIPVSQFTQKRLVIPISIEGAEQFGRVTLLPGAVELTCDVPLDAYASIKAEDFTLRVRFFGDIAPERMLVELVRVPAGVRNVQFSPQYASYLISK